MQVMGVLSGAGYSKIGLITEQEQVAVARCGPASPLRSIAHAALLALGARRAWASAEPLEPEVGRVDRGRPGADRASSPTSAPGTLDSEVVETETPSVVEDDTAGRTGAADRQHRGRPGRRRARPPNADARADRSTPRPNRADPTPEPPSRSRSPSRTRARARADPAPAAGARARAGPRAGARAAPVPSRSRLAGASPKPTSTPTAATRRSADAEPVARTQQSAAHVQEARRSRREKAATEDEGARKTPKKSEDAKSSGRRRPEAEQADQREAAKQADEVANIINNENVARRARPAQGGEPTLGKTDRHVGDAEPVGRSTALVAQIKSCMNTAAGRGRGGRHGAAAVQHRRAMAHVVGSRRSSAATSATTLEQPTPARRSARCMRCGPYAMAAETRKSMATVRSARTRRDFEASLAGNEPQRRRRRPMTPDHPAPRCSSSASPAARSLAARLAGHRRWSRSWSPAAISRRCRSPFRISPRPIRPSASEIADIVRDNLTRSGLFAPLDPASAAACRWATSTAQPDFAAWRARQCRCAGDGAGRARRRRSSRRCASGTRRRPRRWSASSYSTDPQS